MLYTYVHHDRVTVTQPSFCVLNFFTFDLITQLAGSVDTICKEIRGIGNNYVSGVDPEIWKGDGLTI